eukprot:2153267-Amphidinium_carterae.1
MDLSSAGEAQENAIPVGIGAPQFLQWIQMETEVPTSEDGNESVPTQRSLASEALKTGGTTCLLSSHYAQGQVPERIQLMTCNQIGTTAWWHFFTNVGGAGPLILLLVFWCVGSTLYALHVPPQIPMMAPELFYREVQNEIHNIPVPHRSPYYAHYRQYYLQQYQQHVKQYQDMEKKWEDEGPPSLNWSAFMQGIGLGAWVFSATVALCEYRYSTITAWMEMAEDWWATSQWQIGSGGKGTADDIAHDTLVKKNFTEKELSEAVGASRA